MVLQGVGIVSETPALRMSEVARVAAAIAHQVVHDLGPAWAITVPVSPFETLSDIPDDYAQLLVMKTMASGFFGLHKMKNGKFIAFVRHTPKSMSWAIHASHEVIEMLVDPDGQRVARGPSPANAAVLVDFVVEPCDPVQDPEFSYVGINSVPLSNFCTPAYYGLPGGISGAVTCRPALAGPFSIGEGGYVTYRDPATGMFSMTELSGGELSTRPLGNTNPIHGSLRAALDRVRPSSDRLCSRRGKGRLKKLKDRLMSYQTRRWRRGRELEEQVTALQSRLSRR